MKLWDVETGKLLRTFEANPNEVRAVTFSPDGTRVLTASDDTEAKNYREKEAVVRLLDVESGELLRTFNGHTEKIYSLAFSPDGARVLTGGSDKQSLTLWDANTGTLIRTFGSSDWVPLVPVAFSPDGSHVLSSNSTHTVKLWDATTGTLIRTFEGNSSGVTSVAFSPDGARVLSGSWDTTVRMWSVQTGELLASMIGERDREWLTITPGGFFVASPKGSQALSVVRGLKVYSVDQFFRNLYSTEIVEEALKGDPEGKYKDAAYNLNLEKVLELWIRATA